MDLSKSIADNIKLSAAVSKKRQDVIEFFGSKVLQSLEEAGANVQAPQVPVPDMSSPIAAPAPEEAQPEQPTQDNAQPQVTPAPQDNGQPAPQGKPISKVDDMPANKQAYFLALALREVKNIIEMANFNLGNSLQKGRPTITDVYFDRNGSGSVDVVIPFEYESDEQNKEDFSNVTGAFDMELRSEFKDLVSYKINTPTLSHPEVSIEITVTIPQALMKEINVGGFDTRTKVLSKYVENLIRKELM